MNKLFRLPLLPIALTVGSGEVLAQKPISLPEGQLVSYSGVMCGQIQGTWLPGVMNSSGGFITSRSSLAALKKKAKKAKGSQKKRLQKQVKSLQRQITSRSTTCNELGTGVIAPRGSQSAASGATTINWSFGLGGLNSSNIGEIYSYFCPPGGQSSNVWGTDTYTADSSVCNAAVHSGLITREFGGNFRLVIKAGLERYIGSLRNTVNSFDYTNYPLSYSFLKPGSATEISSVAPPIIPWNRALGTFRAALGMLFTVLCPANGSIGSLWGTNVYTDDSKVCSAAVHTGRITRQRGGLVRVRMVAGRSSYTGSSRRGVTSQDYGSFGGSIQIE